MATTKIEVQGMDRVLRLLVQGGAAAVREVGMALYWEANTAFNKSQELVPVATGNLKSSGRVEMPQSTPSGVEVEIAYGTPYGLYVHENLEANHAAPTQAKFLETPVVQQVEGMGGRIADRVEAALRSYS